MLVPYNQKAENTWSPCTIVKALSDLKSAEQGAIVWLEKCSLQELSLGGSRLLAFYLGKPKSAAKVYHDPYPGPSTGPEELFMQ